MKDKEYRKRALRLRNSDYEKIVARFGNKEGDLGKNLDILHAAMGLSTESGEFLDAIKRQIFYGTELDEVNLVEEIGDILWYCQLALESVGSSFAEAREKNINKLEARYPDKYRDKDAKNRDLEKEREVLEK